MRSLRTRLAKALADVHPQRTLPPLALRTLSRWFAGRGERNAGSARVVFWPDTFTNYFEPDVGVAAIETLEAVGFHVTLPQRPLCCGRPLYDYGLLGSARRYLQRVLDGLREEIQEGVPLVGVEPSCVAVFKDELSKLLPHDEDGKRLRAQTFHFSAFLVAQGVRPPALGGRAIVHGHCHQRATCGVESEVELLRRMDVDAELLDSGCCGMAGAWGYEREHYEVSTACAERVLLPAVRAAEDTLVVASGFSCRSQIEQANVRRRALHVAEVMRRALAEGGMVEVETAA